MGKLLVADAFGELSVVSRFAGSRVGRRTDHVWSLRASDCTGELSRLFRCALVFGSI